MKEGGTYVSHLLRSKKELSEIYERQVDMIYRVCFMYFNGNDSDIEDAIQTTFLKLLKASTQFENTEHEKAWLIVTTSNVCRNMLSSTWKKRVELDSEKLERQSISAKIDKTLEYVMELPDKYKAAVYMFYYEGYSCKEIAKSMGKTENSVWGYLNKGRKLLKAMIKED